MIPITVSIFGAKTGVPPRPRAGAGDRPTSPASPSMFGALGTSFGAAGQGVRHLPGQPLGDRAAGAVLRRHGRCRCSAPSSWRCRRGCRSACRASAGAGFGGAFLMGLVGGIIAAPCTGPPLAVAPRLRGDHARRGLGLRAARHLRRRHRPALLAAGRVLDVAAALGALDGVGEERLRHRALRGRALLPQERRAGAGAIRSAARRASRWRWRRWCWSASALGAVHASFHGGAGRAACARRSASALATIGLFGATNYVLAPKGDVKLRLAAPTSRAPSPTARAAGRPLLVDFAASWCLPCQRVRGEGLLATRGGRGDAARSRSCASTSRARTTIRRWASIKQKYGADTLPAIRLVSPDGALVAKTDSSWSRPRSSSASSAARLRAS